ncbi:helix-turn-helix domain-containing protein [Deinococcus sp. NW-56]|uniref:helix-turn-helix domain-containing protein n=1 Tax=Deinococcus sp. NW-56 TaxID=2080419 RepID=UPI001F35E817|nr:helix-turn-helix domain-containing protein [Deinococcus sp. NW-56]
MTASYLPDQQEQAQLMALVQALGEQDGTLELRIPGQAGGLAVAPTLARLLQEAAQELARGHAVTLIPTEQHLSTHEAARLLDVSRPFLIARLLDTGKLPHHRVGSHRRIALSDLLAYQAEQERRQALADELTAEAQQMGLY